MNKREYLAAISSFVPLGSTRLNLLLSFFETPSKVWNASANKLLETGMSSRMVDEFLGHRSKFNAKRYFNRLNRLGIKYLLKNDGEYPANLKEIDDAPHVLYLKGRLKEADVNSIAVVGSRKMSPYGRAVARQFSSELALMGFTVVSGLAKGVDTEAHISALDAGGRTIAVMGCGLDRIYPLQNTALFQRIVRNSSAVVSEYPLGYPTLPVNFASRNRIISGLSKAVVVIEGELRSGTLLTASRAAEQGRMVFAVPGQINSSLSEAPHFLIENGARLVTRTKDILEELGEEGPLPGDEEILLGFLAEKPRSLDELAKMSSLGSARLSARLTVMKVKGLVVKLSEGLYRKKT